MRNRMSEPTSASAGLQMPGWIRGAVFSLIGVATAGGLYLLAVRGDALMADLSSLAMLICG